MDLTTAIIGIVVSSIMSIIFSNQIVNFIGVYLTKIDFKKQSKIEGDWLVEFTMIENNQIVTYTEGIRLVKRLGNIYGYNIPHTKNHYKLKVVESKKPLRVRASLVDHRYLTGNWFHPDELSRFHGAFQLLIKTNQIEMNGIWTGYSESKNRIHTGEWNWIKIN